MKVGVIGVQGAVSEHIDCIEKALRESGREGSAVWVRSAGDMDGVHALIIPGGESTAISRLVENNGLGPRIIEHARLGRPVMGTCAGCVLLAKKGGADVVSTGTKLLGLMDMEVERNAFGRQKESFEAPVEVEGIGNYPAVFIRAPVISRVWDDCRPLASFNGRIVMARQGNIIALAFHPELSGDLRLHGMLIDMVRR